MEDLTTTGQEARASELKPGSHVHLVGIGGFGLSAIARVLLAKGFVVSGSDLQSNKLIEELVSQGATVYLGHDSENWSGADALLISSAIPSSNPELISAKEAGLPVMKRAEIVGNLMGDSFGIAIAGSHGKTTTTGMIAHILVQAGLDPSVIIGGVLPLFGANGHAGAGDYFVVEADEYDYMFLGLRPQLSVITNIEYDHPDIFPTITEYRSAFSAFADLIPETGTVIFCADDPVSREMARAKREYGLSVVTYGQGKADWRALEIRPNHVGGNDFLVSNEESTIGLARLRVPGTHNVQNALAATVVGRLLDIPFEVIRTALAEFTGMGRRFQVLGEAGGVVVIDDYAHHPTEIRATLSAARGRYGDRRIWAVWQPHTYSRIKSLLDEFAACFDDAELVSVLDIYRSRELDTLGINESVVAASLRHPSVHHAGGILETAAYILDRVKPGDVIITLSAGDGNLVGESVLSGLRLRIGNRSSTNGHQSGTS